MPDNTINVFGAREHNLKNVDVQIPKNSLTVITGPSGSGKSSLALDILFAEGKRRYMESLSSYARQFLGIVKKPAFDRIDGLCPSIAIEQKTVGHNPRSTVGTITEIYDYLRVLYARIGVPHCPACRKAIDIASPEKVTQSIIQTYGGHMVTIAAPVVDQKKGEFTHVLTSLIESGYARFIINGTMHTLRSQSDIEALALRKTYRHSIEVLIDVLEVAQEEADRVQEAVEKAFKLAHGMCVVRVGDTTQRYSMNRMCVECGRSFPELEPRLFSFNSPIGACSGCHGLGIENMYMWREDGDDDMQIHDRPCAVCDGRRLNEFARAVTVQNTSIFEIGQLSIKHALLFFESLVLDASQATIAAGVIKEISSRLRFLSDVGLDYLSLNRTARTLSGGEGQRIRLATQIGSALSGVLYILDEPSIGLHQRDNDRLIATLKSLRDQGNTVVVVEHDIDTIKQADYLIDMGPAAGVLGGSVTAVGSPEQLAHDSASLTGAYLSGKRGIAMPHALRKATGSITLKNATKNNLAGVTVSIPTGVLCGISGVSGSGKSTLVFEELVPGVQQELMRPRVGHYNHHVLNGRESEVDIDGPIRDVVVIDQSPIGRTPRSNPATYLGIFNDIRALFAQLPESNARGYTQGRFSFNVAQGRCFECSGDGIIKVSMHFLPDVTMVCKSCKGRRYDAQTLEITYRGKSIADVLDMTAYEALEFFKAHTPIAKRLKLLCNVGLDYIALGQSATTFSGGEAQRIKLVKELAKRGTQTLYVLDEPTTGLHNSDIEKLLVVLNTLVNKGNSMVIIEHNVDVLKTVDYLIDMGPEGGDQGGTIVAQGTPEQVSRIAASHTGHYLKQFFFK